MTRGEERVLQALGNVEPATLQALVTETGYSVPHLRRLTRKLERSRLARRRPRNPRDPDEACEPDLWLRASEGDLGARVVRRGANRAHFRRRRKVSPR